MPPIVCAPELNVTVAARGLKLAAATLLIQLPALSMLKLLADASSVPPLIVNEVAMEIAPANVFVPEPGKNQIPILLGAIKRGDRLIGSVVLNGAGRAY